MFKIQVLPGARLQYGCCTKRAADVYEKKCKQHLQVKRFLPWMHEVPNLADKAEPHIWQNRAIKVVSQWYSSQFRNNLFLPCNVNAMENVCLLAASVVGTVVRGTEQSAGMDSLFFILFCTWKYQIFSWSFLFYYSIGNSFKQVLLDRIKQHYFCFLVWLVMQDNRQHSKNGIAQGRSHSLGCCRSKAWYLSTSKGHAE